MSTLLTVVLFISSFYFYPENLALAVNRKLALIVMIADQHHTFSRENLSATARYVEMATTAEVKTLYLKPEDLKKFGQTLLTVLSPEEKIDYLIIATHGETDLKANSTNLYNLGGFSSVGAQGKFRDIILSLKSHYSKSLTIYFDACSAFCGTREQILERSLGLYKEFSKLNVEILNIWGASVDMNATNTRFNSKIDNIIASEKSILKWAIPGSFLGELLIAALSEQHANIVWHALKFTPMMTGAVTVLLNFIYRNNIFFNPGETGFLVSINRDSADIQPVDRLTPRAFGRLETCVGQLEALSDAIGPKDF